MYLLDRLFGDRHIYASFIILLAVLFVDVSLIKILNLLFVQSDNYWRVNLFTTTTILYVILMVYIIIGSLKKGWWLSGKAGRRGIPMPLIIAQSVLLSLIAIVLVQLLSLHQYSTFFLIMIVAASYALGIYILVALTKHFVIWSKSNRTNKAVIGYSVSFIVISTNLVLTLIVVVIASFSWSSASPSFIGTTAIYIKSGSPLELITSADLVTSIVAFGITWYSTTLLLSNYSEKIGKKSYWIFLSIPLVYFMGQYVVFYFSLFTPLFTIDPFFYGTLITLLFALSKPVGGILFGIAFWAIAKKIPLSYRERRYLIVSAFGFILLFVSNQAILLINIPFPPFGLIASSTTGFACYLVSMGLYFSAISVAHDASLRQRVRKMATPGLTFLDSIGTAEMQRYLERRVVELVERNRDILDEGTTGKSDLSDDEVRKYVEEALAEVKARRGLKENEEEETRE